MTVTAKRSKITNPVDVNYHRQFRKMEATMKVWELILAVVVVFLISEDAFAWKDKSKMTNDDRERDRQQYRNCTARCDDQYSEARARCNYIWSNDATEANRCIIYK